MKERFEKVKGFIRRHKDELKKGATMAGLMFMGYTIGKKKTMGKVSEKLCYMCLINPDFSTSLKETERQLNEFKKNW